jgi:RNA-directed DNA polymerase
MQRKLATWTSTDKTRRVNRLLRLISHPVWLEHAAKITLSSAGANTAGIDGITKVHLQGNLDVYLNDIRLSLFSGNINQCLLNVSIFQKPMVNSDHWVFPA